LAVVGTAAPAVAGTDPDFEAPFPCRQQWTASTRPDHSPNVYSVDFNRYDDYRNAVVASAPGVVSTVSDAGSSGYGKLVVVDHGAGWLTYYAHLDEQWVVPGQRVDQGQYIGLLGTTGGSTGPHLHFEQRLNGITRAAVFHGTRLVYDSEITSRNCGDVPVVGDWNGDRQADLGIFRRAATAKFRLRLPDATATDVPLGSSVAEPVAGDWDGDGVTDLGTWDRATKTFSLATEQETTTVQFGGRKDNPVTGDWDGDGRTDVGAFRPRTGTFRLLFPSGSQTRFRFGSVGSTPVTGDWNGDGRTDVGVFDAATGGWVLRNDDGTSKSFTFGEPGSLPVAGDWNGNGTTDVGVWSPKTATYTLRAAKKSQVQQIKWGLPR